MIKSKLITKAFFFTWFSFINLSINKWYLFVFKSLGLKSAEIIEVCYTKELIPFSLSMLAKTDFKDLFKVFLKHKFIEGVCVNTCKKNIASSFVLRFVDDSVMVDRFFFIFSPSILDITVVTKKNGFMLKKKYFKGKLFFIKACSQKQLYSLFLKD